MLPPRARCRSMSAYRRLPAAVSVACRLFVRNRSGLVVCFSCERTVVVTRNFFTACMILCTMCVRLLASCSTPLTDSFRYERYDQRHRSLCIPFSFKTCINKTRVVYQCALTTRSLAKILGNPHMRTLLLNTLVAPSLGGDRYSAFHSARSKHQSYDVAGIHDTEPPERDTVVSFYFSMTVPFGISHKWSNLNVAEE